MSLLEETSACKKAEKGTIDQDSCSNMYGRI